ncbi:MAG TPA: alpha/beta hydrolase [Noviherbaspirillum sp.]|uniref:alpha/beta fold hydrolase n=1 Tax=Noviherbaspirillum sp. TaxID=1926288 RepID=UPI002DDD779E|nr:alpha/beta hydrolase [Noviherbaspirillum sp.]HEV2612382.1 alpha/beta hydrolase [Noviherbaspirillum sp.]
MNYRTRPADHSETTNRLSSWRSGRVLGAGIALATAALYVAYRNREAERNYPPEGKFIDVDGVSLHYFEKGEGDPLVLLHGNTTMGMDFTLSGLVDMAAQHYRVIVFDRPGYGYSERPRTTLWGSQAQAKLLNAALRKIGARKPIVLGHSLGALVAIAMALDSPESVRSLVLTSGYYYPTMRPEIPLTAQPAIPVVGDLMRYTITPIMLRLNWPFMLKREFTPAPVAESMKKLPPWLVLRPTQIRASSAEMILMYPDVIKLGKRYHELQMPIVLVAGSGDRLVYRSKHSDCFHAEFPHTEYRVIDGAGHMVHHIAPSEVMDAIHSAARSAMPGFTARNVGMSKPSLAHPS